MATLKSDNIQFAQQRSNQDVGLDSLQEFRDHTMMIIGWATVPFLLLFSINNFIQQRSILGALSFSVALLLAINSFCIYRYKKQFASYWLFFVVTLVALLYAISSIGTKGLFWCYPTLFVMGFITNRSEGRLMTISGFITLVPCAFYFLSMDVAIRFLITLSMACFFSDLLVHHLIRMQEKLTELAIRDPLTNAFNRRHMDSYLQEAIEETKRGFGPASLMLLDIDNFKEINDALGHETGDNVLKDMVQILHLRQRRLDYVFRIGGEEFLVLLRNTSLQQAQVTAENLRQYVEKKKLHKDKTITISIGVAEYDGNESSDEWLARSDTHLYEAKNRGRNCVFPVIDL